MKNVLLILATLFLALNALKSQTANTAFPDTNADVYAVVRNGNFIYVCGDFTTIGGVALNGLARVNATTNAVDATWNPNFYNTVFSTGGYLRSIVFSPDGTKLYAAGIFDKVGGAMGATRTCLAQINVATATATSWDNSTPSVFDPVNRLVISSTGDVYAYGTFSAIIEGATATTFTRNGLVGINAAGLVTAFDPQATNANPFREMAISADGSRIYIGLGNSTVSFVGVSRRNFAELNASDGTTTAWNPDPDGGVFSVIQTGTTLYLSGGFETIDGTARNHVAKFNNALTTPTLDPTFTNGAKGTIRGSFFDGSDVYILGDFKTAEAVFITGMAKLNGTTGVASATWRVGANNFSAGTSQKLFGSVAHQQLYPCNFSNSPTSFLGRSERRLHVFNYNQTNQLAAETGFMVSPSATPVTLNFTGTTMILEMPDMTSFSDCFPLADRYTDAPQNVSGIAETNISSYRFVFKRQSLNASAMTLRFDLDDLPTFPASPNMIKIYYRNTPNQGAFTNAGTVTYNGVTHTLSIDAATILGSSFGLIEFVFASPSVLPIEYSAFSVKKQDKTALIAWKTASEDKNVQFIVRQTVFRLTTLAKLQVVV
jgi:hypothetical protein